MFVDPSFTALGVRNVRLMVPWDVRRVRNLLPVSEEWLARAKAQRLDVLVVFARDDARPGAPAPAAYAREVRWFVRRHPEVRAYAPWNEANLCTQSICRRPERAAAYHRLVRAACPTCRVLGAELVAGLPPARAVPPSTYVRGLSRALGARPRLWGLHSYTDPNRFQTRWTVRALRSLPGEVWLDETGGMAHRPPHRRALPAAYRYAASPQRQARVTRFVLDRLARVSPRIRRVYLYQWGSGSPVNWDSGLISPDGRPRPAYRVVRDALRPVRVGLLGGDAGTPSGAQPVAR